MNSLLLLSGQVALGVKVSNNLLNSILDRQIHVLKVDLGLLRRLVGSGDTSELLNDTLTSLLVQALRITLLGNLNGDINVHLNEGETGALAGRGDFVQLAGSVTVLAVRRDERGNGDGARVGEQLGDLCDAADVLVAVGFAEAKVLVQAEADVVAVQTVGVHAAVVEQLALEFDGNGGLARGGETGQPDRQTLLVAQGAALGLGQGGGVEGDVAAAGLVIASFLGLRDRSHARGEM